MLPLKHKIKLPKRTKYNNRTTKFQGNYYDSKLEANCAMWLASLLREKKITAIKVKPKIDLTVNKVHIGNHYVDFIVTLPSGRIKFVEAKGLPTGAWVMKQRLTKALYPEIPYLIFTDGSGYPCVTEKELLV